METNGVLYNAIVGFLVMTFITIAVICWKYAKTIKAKILMKYSGKTEFESIDLDMLTTTIIFVMLFLIPAVLIIYLINVVFP
jgi:hypothetical protein